MTIRLLPQPSAEGYVLLEGSDLLLPGQLVRLSDAGKAAHPSTDANRPGVVVRRARDGRHIWVLWDGLKRPYLYLDRDVARLVQGAARRHRAAQRRARTSARG